MTGYASEKVITRNFELAIEIKSYNAKGCEPQLKLSHEIGYLEQEIRKLLNVYVQRGKVYLFIKYTNLREKKGKVMVNNSIIPEIRKSIAILEEKMGHPVEFSYRDALSVPDFINIIYDADEKNNTDSKELISRFTSVLADFLLTQEKEGAELKKDIEKRFLIMQKASAKIHKLGKESVEDRRVKIEKLMSRILDDEKISPEKVENELALQLCKLDITEELVRLGSHFKQLRNFLDCSRSKNTLKKDILPRCKSYKPIGLEIDFLCQEILREANTINSKSDDINIIKSSIVIKTEITRLREQVRNIK